MRKDNSVPVAVAYEDDVHAALLDRLLFSRRHFVRAQDYSKGGNSYLKSKAKDFASIGSFMPLVLVTDLDNIYPCVTALKEDWGLNEIPSNMILAVAKREAEAWVMGDRERFSEFFRVNIARLSATPEELTSPKQYLIDQCRHSLKRTVREDMTPTDFSRLGPGYNILVPEFISYKWRPSEARKLCPSLDRFIKKLDGFKPVYRE